MRIIVIAAGVWMLAAPGCMAGRRQAPVPAGGRFAMETLDPPLDSTVRAFKARLGAGSGPAPLFIIDGVVCGGAVDSLRLHSPDIVTVEVLKPAIDGEYFPHLRTAVVSVTTRGASGRRGPVCDQLTGVQGGRG